VVVVVVVVVVLVVVAAAIYGRPENFRESLSTPTATFPKIFNGFCSDRSYECAYKI